MPEQVFEIHIVSMVEGTSSLGSSVAGIGVLRKKDESDEEIADRVSRSIKPLIMLALKRIALEQEGAETREERYERHVQARLSAGTAKTEEEMAAILDRQEAEAKMIVVTGVPKTDEEAWALLAILSVDGSPENQADLLEIIKTTPPGELPVDLYNDEKPAEPQADVLAITMPPYEMPAVSYEELKESADPSCPHRGVFPPSPPDNND